jgi:hypothetical protein
MREDDVKSQECVCGFKGCFVAADGILASVEGWTGA